MTIRPVHPVRTVAALLLAVAVFAAIATPADAQEKVEEVDRAAVLAANAEFYRAFREGDMKAMDAVWGEAEPIVVVHPSSWREEGRARVLASWAIILQAPPRITCSVEGVTFANGQATVQCLENLNPGQVRMINVFHREGGNWRMIYHGPAEARVT